MSRNYRKEYDNYQSRPKQRKNRAKRNSARSIMIKKNGMSSVAGKDIHHKDGNPQNNAVSNLSIKSKSKNRSRI